MRNPSQLTTLCVLALGAWLGPQVATGPHLFDAGELAEASVMLGGSHPPGQPLHAILSHAFLWIPLGSMAARLSLFSLMTTLCAALAMAALTEELLAASRIDGWIRELAKAAAALSLVLADPVLRQALRIEVYGLSLLLTLASIALLMRWARLAQARYLLAAAFCAGLCASAHPPQAASAVLVGLALVAVRPKLLTRKPSALVLAALFCVLGLAPYAYLFVRGLAHAPMWGTPTTLAGLLEYVTARAYAQNVVYGSADQSLLQNALAYGRYVVLATYGLPLVGTAILFAMRPVHAWLPRGLALAVLAVLTAVSLQPLQENVPDHVAYASPMLGIVLALAAAGFASLGVFGGNASSRRPQAWLGVAALVCLPLASAAHARTANTLRADLPLLETLTHALVETPPPRALVVATTDFTGASWMMSRAIDRTRPDVALFVAGLSTSSWQWRSLSTHPAFDGKPHRGPGRDGHERYLHGAISYALERVPVVLERDTALINTGAVVGGYALLEARSTLSAMERPRALTRSIGERLERMIAAALVASPGGDSDAASAIARDHFIQRAERLLRTGQSKLALHALRSALPLIPERERALIAIDRELPVRSPPVIAEPHAFLVSQEHAVRIAAAALWALGKPEAALALLEAQTARGDARGVLQLCALQASIQAHSAALACLENFQSLAPALAAEAHPLLTALHRSHAQPSTQPDQAPTP